MYDAHRKSIPVRNHTAMEGIAGQSHKRDFLPYSPLKGRKHTSREHNPLARFNPLRDGRKAAIDAMCAACVGCTPEEAEPGFKRAISKCSSKQCPLWTYRPFQPAGEEL